MQINYSDLSQDLSARRRITRMTKNEPRAVGRWKKYKSCFGFVCMGFGKVSFNGVRIAAKNAS